MESGKGTVYPLEYHSNVLRRVCRSTLQAETLSMIQGHEEAEHFRTVLYALQHDLEREWQVAALDHKTIYLLTDCRSLEAHLLQPGLGTTSDKRLAIDINALGQTVWRQPGELLGNPLYGDSVPLESTTKPEWIETHSMVSDALTKRMQCPQLLKLMEIGWLAVDRDKTSKKPSGTV